MSFRLTRGVISILLAMFLFQGCIKEDLAECVFRLDFNFRQVGEDEDVSLEKISSLSVFAFDEKGIFVQEYKVNNPQQHEIVKIPLPDGNYTLVTWAGFTESQRVEANLTKGTSKITDLYMRTFTTEPGGNVAAPNPLYYGIIRNAAIALPPEIVKNDIQLVHSAKPINIRLTNLEPSEYKLIITNNAAKYNADNVLVRADIQDASTVQSMTAISPPGSYFTKASMIWPDALGKQEIKIVNLKTGFTILTLSLDDLLDKIPGVDFDKEHQIDMIINFLANSKVQVYINGWLIVYSDDEV